MKTLEEIIALYRAARGIVKAGDDDSREVVIQCISQISAHCRELYNNASIYEKAKCRVRYEALDKVVAIVKVNGVNCESVKSFFGLIKPTANAPYFGDVMGGSNSAVTEPSRTLPGAAPKDQTLDDFINSNCTESGAEATFSDGASSANEPKVGKTQEAPKQQTPDEAPNNTVSDIAKVSEDAEAKGAPCIPVSPETDGFTPCCLADFIGQEHVVKRISAEISAAKKQGLKHIDNILLFGNRGLGKSTLMKLIAKELGVDYEFMDSSALSNDVRSQRKMENFWKRISENNKPVVIAFDEIHALPKHIQTGLLTLLNDRVYSYMDENGINHTYPINEFTFIGATTDAQDVLPTIKDRCNNLTFYLKDYTRDELAKIFINKFTAWGFKITDEVLSTCIDRCRSSIREVEAFVKGLRTIALNAETDLITIDMAEAYFEERKLDPIGLNATDIEILENIYKDGSGVLSEDTLAARVHLDPKVMVKEFEPYLLKIGFVNITHRGRCLTQKAIDYMAARENRLKSDSKAVSATEASPNLKTGNKGDNKDV